MRPRRFPKAFKELVRKNIEIRKNLKDTPVFRRITYLIFKKQPEETFSREPQKIS